MIKDKVHFTEVIEAEYKNVFDFYVNHLQFQYLTGNAIQINQCLNELDTRGEKYYIIEALKCESDYIIYMDRGIK